MKRPALAVSPVVDWGPGFVEIGASGRMSVDAALLLHASAGDGDTVASIEVVTAEPEALLDITPKVGLELTPEDCIELARRLLDAAGIVPLTTTSIDQGVCPDGHTCVLWTNDTEPRFVRRCINGEYTGARLYDAQYDLNATNKEVNTA